MNQALSVKILEIVHVRRRFGYRRIHGLLRPEFAGVNHKRVRLYHAEVSCGLSRSLGIQSKPKIRDRGLASRILELERQLEEHPADELSEELRDIANDAPTYARGTMHF